MKEKGSQGIGDGCEGVKLWPDGQGPWGESVEVYSSPPFDHVRSEEKGWQKYRHKKLKQTPQARLKFKKQKKIIGQE